MYRLFDIVLSSLGLVIGFPLLLVIYILILCESGSPIFRQERVGRNKNPFILMKFRTMDINTASVATHLVGREAITPLGILLRRVKLDELPQLWNVLKGEMSLVGPRPCLFNQDELIAERDARGVYDVRPGVTGLAQVNNINMSTPALLARTDQEMIANLSAAKYFRYIIMTIIDIGTGGQVKD